MPGVSHWEPVARSGNAVFRGGGTDKQINDFMQIKEGGKRGEGVWGKAALIA